MRLAESEEKMTNLTKLRNWLLTFPGWDEGWVLHTDHTEAEPGNSGLFPLGAEELSRREDVLGNVTVQCRYRFYLYRVTGQADPQANAEFLLELQQWVRQQSATGAAPRFGDDPKQERLRAEKGKLSEVSQTGTGTYIVTLTAEFVKIYGGNENGKN